MIQKQYGFLRLGYFVAGRDCTTIQYTANLAELAYGSFKVRNPLGWDELLACLLQKFGGIIDFAGSGLAQGQLSNRLCKAEGQAVYRFFGGRRASAHSVKTHRIATLVEERHESWSESHLAGRKIG